VQLFSVVQCTILLVIRLTCNADFVGSSRITGPVVYLSKKLYPNCLVLVGSRNGFERDFTIELNEIEGLMEDCKISSFVKYRQTQNQILVCLYFVLTGNIVFFRKLLDQRDFQS